MPYADWLISGLEKVISPAQEIHLARSRNLSFQLVKNTVQIQFQRKLKFIMPYSVDEKHSPSEFYYPGETNYPNATFQGEDNAEQNNSSENVVNIVFTTL